MTPAEIKRIRHRLGLTQAQLAPWMEVDTNSLARIEQGRREPPIRFCALLRAYELGYRPADFPLGNCTTLSRSE